MIKVKEIDNKRLAVSFEYDSVLINKIRQIKGSWWHKDDKCWIVINNAQNRDRKKSSLES